MAVTVKSRPEQVRERGRLHFSGPREARAKTLGWKRTWCNKDGMEALASHADRKVKRERENSERCRVQISWALANHGGKYGFNFEYESETMEAFEQESDKPDLHILKQLLVPVCLLCFQFCLWEPVRAVIPKA